jgi:acid phosphatase
MHFADRLRANVVPLLIGVLIGAVGVTLATGQLGFVSAQPAAMPAFAPAVPAARGLDGALWVQTSAEYRACCLQAYNVARVRLTEKLKDKTIKKPALVFDLDETVLDNAGHEAMILRSGLAGDDRLWNIWETQHARDVGLVPGAGEFIRWAAKEQGVEIYYISNRDAKNWVHTVAVLENLNLPLASPKHLKLRAGKSGDKTSRREEVKAEATVLLYFGDNLRDFDEQFKCGVDNTQTPQVTDPDKLANAIKERKDKVDASRARWGDEWIILPNPVYGEWTKPLGLGTKDFDRLVAPRP